MARNSNPDLRETLRRFKREGSAVLVVGAVPRETATELARRLLAVSGSERRHRLLVTTRRDGGDAFAPDVDDDGHVEVVECRPLGRGASASPRPVAVGNAVERTVVGSPTLGMLATTVADRIDAIARERGPLGPAALRVGFESLLPLIETHSVRTVFRFLHLVLGRIRAEAGLGHAYLPLEREHEHVALFAPLFDAVVELRHAADGPEQRWHVRAAGERTPWFQLPAER